jgi:hypothetical protein
VSGLQFLAAIVNSLAWPAVVVVAAVLWRRELAAILGRVESLELLGGKAKFSTLPGIQKMIAATARDVGVPYDETAIGPAQPEFTALDALVPAAPQRAIVDAWTLLEYQLNAAADRLAPDPQHGWPQVARSLENWDRWQLLSPAVMELRRLRDATVQPGKPPTSEDAARYVSVVQDVVATLRTISRSDGDGGGSG